MRKNSDNPFYIPKKGDPDRSKSITSFLCTEAARDIYGAAAKTFADYASGAAKLDHEKYQPVDKDGKPVATALTNAECLTEIKCFRAVY